MPRLSTIHPYPAMTPDELATRLVHEYGGTHLLDPFCGTGRVCLAAAESGARAVGIDVNPLAILISRAKSHSDKTDNLNDVLEDLLTLRRTHTLRGVGVDPCAGRNVRWLGAQAAHELSELTHAIGMRSRSWPTLLILAAALSATVREVSFARQDQWKLHRLSPHARATVRQDAWNVFARRLQTVWKELLTANRLPGTCAFSLGDARNISPILQRLLPGTLADVIITSPPYGDSRTTVQYGAMSSLCMHVVSKIPAFQSYTIVGAEVERAGLGGRLHPTAIDARHFLTGYWAGGAQNTRQRSAAAYLRDLRAAIRASAACLRPRGLFVTVVARRLIGGWRLKTDQFMCDTLTSLGFTEVSRTRRRIAAKVTPPIINRGASRDAPWRRPHVHTIREEWILVHQAPQQQAVHRPDNLPRRQLSH